MCIRLLWRSLADAISKAIAPLDVWSDSCNRLLQDCGLIPDANLQCPDYPTAGITVDRTRRSTSKLIPWDREGPCARGIRDVESHNAPTPSPSIIIAVFVTPASANSVRLLALVPLKLKFPP